MEINAKIFFLFLFNTLIITVFGQSYGIERGSGQCRWGAIGMCRRGNTYCPTGSRCRFLGHTSNTGLCCRESLGVCPADITGPSCSEDDPCKPGYICRNGVCCRDPVCPKGWIEGGSCNTFAPELCPEGFECINNQFCCRSTFCPSGSIGPQCSKRNPCKTGYSCRGGNCCREPVCPQNWLEDGVCNFTPGHSFCAEGFDCSNDFCCKTTGPPPQIPVCKQPKEVGPCRAAFPRWFYNFETKACERFIYGGCRGNDNNFEFQEDCEKRCGPRVPVCQQPMTVGPCDAAIPRWFYNLQTGSCEEFTFGGCGANDNNFVRKEDCEKRCEVCPYGQEGVCGTIAGLACGPETECRFLGNFPDAGGKCCINAPPVECEFGSSGTCVISFPALGRPCLPGYTCKVPPGGKEGKCCKNDAHECPLGQDGVCGIVGDVGVNCKPGTTCIKSKCCIDDTATEPTDLCGESQIHREECGGFVGVQCASGFTCTRRGGSSLGICCPVEQQPNDICGESIIHRDTCLGFANAQCGVGFTCIRKGGTLGICCPSQQGTCPPPSGRFTTCQFIEGINCLNDSACRRGELCCREGCGRVCKNAVFEPSPTTS